MNDMWWTRSNELMTFGILQLYYTVMIISKPVKSEIEIMNHISFLRGNLGFTMQIKLHSIK